MYQKGGAVGFQETFKALSDSTRREILDLLKDGSMPAGEICSHFDMTGASSSHHLNILKQANLITDKKQGKYIYYELNLSILDETIMWISNLRGDQQ